MYSERPCSTAGRTILAVIATFNGVASGPCAFPITLSTDIILSGSTTTINDTIAAVTLTINRWNSVGQTLPWSLLRSVPQDLTTSN